MEQLVVYRLIDFAVYYWFIKLYCILRFELLVSYDTKLNPYYTVIDPSQTFL